MRCEDVQEELEAFISDDVDGARKSEMQSHLDKCQDCSRALRQLRKLSEVLETWQGIEPSPMMYEKLKARIESRGSLWAKIFTTSFARKAALRFVEVVAIAALTLLISHLLQKPGTEMRVEPVAGWSDDLTTINFYLTEHQVAVAQTISADIPPRPAARMYLDRDDIMYYEFMDDFPEFTRPGVIFRGPASQPEISSPKAPTISNGHILTLSQARNAVDFDLVAPPRLHPGYILDSIRKIDGHNSLHLLYTNGIDTLSLFEQPLEGERRLAAQDFREYAVYRGVESAADWLKQDAGTILAWSTGDLSFVLISKVDMSQLMDMAQFISAAKGKVANGTNERITRKNL